MLKTFIGGVFAVVVGGFLLLLLVGIISDQRACSLDTVQSIVDREVNKKLSRDMTIANAGGAFLNHLRNVILKGNNKRPDISYSYKIRSITTVSNNMKEASCTALVDVTVNVNQDKMSSDTHQISYTMRKDDKNMWIVYVDMSGLDD